MTDDKPGAESSRYTSAIANIRNNVPMYIGGVNFFGFVQYLVSAFDLLLQNGATWIEIEVKQGEIFNDEFHFASDALLPLRINRDGFLEPFEAFPELKTRHLPDAAILMALSERLVLTVTHGNLETYMECESGERQAFHQRPTEETGTAAHITFSPDYSIFSVTEISPAVLQSYCRRTACLHPGVSLRIRAGDELAEYKSERGIRDIFDAIAAPYQILHNPIHLSESKYDLEVEAVFVFHSWSENRILSFANKGRVPDGGTHEAGMLDAIGRLRNASSSIANVGIFAVLAIEYPHITFEGCIKARVGNPELREQVSSLLLQGLAKWIAENEEEVEYLETIERFQFADNW